jgi:hypothetical protein
MNFGIKTLYNTSPSQELTDSQQRIALYEWLSREFRRVEESLDEEGRTYLDGKLWQLSETLQEKGFKR